MSTDALFVLLENEIQNQGLGTMLAHCSWGTWLENTRVYKLMETHTLLLSVYALRYEALSNILNFKSLSQD